MPGFRVNITTTQKGTVFDAARTRRMGEELVANINEAMAVEGVNRVKARLSTVLRNPSGFYESRIAVERRVTYRGVYDRGVLYGGWLEGVDRRNATTRFKGYHTFRLVKQELQADMKQIAQPVVNKYIEQMNK